MPTFGRRDNHKLLCTTPVKGDDASTGFFREDLPCLVVSFGDEAVADASAAAGGDSGGGSCSGTSDGRVLFCRVLSTNRAFCDYAACSVELLRGVDLKKFVRLKQKEGSHLDAQLEHEVQQDGGGGGAAPGDAGGGAEPSAWAGSPPREGSFTLPTVEGPSLNGVFCGSRGGDGDGGGGGEVSCSSSGRRVNRGQPMKNEGSNGGERRATASGTGEARDLNVQKEQFRELGEVSHVMVKKTVLGRKLLLKF